MKPSLIVLLLVATIAQAQNRGDSGTRGGGGTEPLRKAALRALLEGESPIKVKLRYLAERANPNFVPERFRQDYVDLVNREVTDSAGNVHRGIIGDLRSPYKVVDSSIVGPNGETEKCEANGVQVPASSGINRPGEDICFDVAMLEEQNTTLHELVGTASHEHAWHLGILDHNHRLEQAVAALSERFDQEVIQGASNAPGARQPIAGAMCAYGISIGSPEAYKDRYAGGYIMAMGSEKPQSPRRAVFTVPCGSKFIYMWAFGTKSPVNELPIVIDINGLIVHTRNAGLVIERGRRFNGGLGEITQADWEQYLALTAR